ncbi:MAG: hypothetical protein L0332_30235 [Chloroflexi bacterium]|nr:hypothetical protein [Chloroflexota bacterium]MCI0578092.1 hypothetical protein [Chloroflexota bacterium]MCI0646080.1 hypothetical protein [Chloroflexota bacterium]MCI0730982.1 hypothetical protein [Chloroflexota bacterium]
MNEKLERFYSLLPEIYRVYDDQQGLPLKALLSVIFEQVEALQEDLEQLYDDQFIETCADWVVPYIGDLIGYRGLHGVVPEVSSPRAEVANTISYRRRKGPAATLEQLAQDVTGWKARTVEFFERLATTQHMNHLRLYNQVTPDLRQVEALGRLNTAFDRLTHALEVRRVRRGGRYNIAHVGLFLWRLGDFPITAGTAKKLAAGCFTFHPLGMDAPLFNSPATEKSITHLAEPVNVPEPLVRRELFLELERQRQALADGQSTEEARRVGAYFSSPPVLRLFVPGAGGLDEIFSEEILICDLSDPQPAIPEFWRRPPNSKNYQPTGKPGDPPVGLTIRVAVDPSLGRLAFPAGVDVEQVLVSYAHGFSHKMGSGQYGRATQPAPAFKVPQSGLTVQQALNSLATQDGAVEIAESRTLSGDLTITLAADQVLTLQAGNGFRPVLDGQITINAAQDATLTLDGLLITGGVEVGGTEAMTLVVKQCTLAPWLEKETGQPKPPTAPSVKWEAASLSGESKGRLVLDHTICGRLLAGSGVRVEILDSIVDALDDVAFALAASTDGSEASGVLEVRRSTIFGRVYVREVELAENSIFTGQLQSKRKQQGCVRFSYVPPNSQTPRQYNCQPALATRQAIAQAREDNPSLTPAEEAQIQAQVEGRLEPIFTAREYSHPGYAQLLLACPIEIRNGAEDEAEMGAFHDLYQPQRETNLRVRLEEYLRFGLEAGIYYAS